MAVKVIITGGSKGIGKAICDRLTPFFTVIDLSRSKGVDLLEEIPEIDCDILICNAGVWEGSWKDVMRLNCEVPIVLADQMPKDRLVIFILSNAAYKNYGNDAYTASKSGLLMYVRRKQEHGYNFATISPGTVRTGFTGKNEERGYMFPDTIARKVAQIIVDFAEGALTTEHIIVPRKK